MQNDYLVSVIIPHYNSPELLGRLLESVPDPAVHHLVNSIASCPFSAVYYMHHHISECLKVQHMQLLLCCTTF